jgi:DNA-binding response OmpR family regulator
VDADPKSRKSLSRELAGRQLVFAAGARDALPLVYAGSFNAYLLEFWLMDWTGPSLCREIRKLDPHAPILFHTAAAHERARARALRAGADAYIIKPATEGQLAASLQTWLERAAVNSLSARYAEERAIQDELERRAQQARLRADAARQLAADAIERTARAKALKAFVEARGTLAHFENWWPQMFSTARASDAVSRSASREEQAANP